MLTNRENLGDDIQAEAACRLWKVRDTVDRDDPASWPQDSVVPLIGWWGRAKFPPASTVRIVGFHCAWDGVPELKRNREWFKQVVASQGFPAFCRDLFTRDLFRKLGIDAEFGGCVSLTLPRVDGPRDAPPLSIDAGRSDPKFQRLTHADYNLGKLSPSERLALASKQLARLADAQSVVTSRLHAWLPCLAMGTPAHLKHARMGSRERLGGYNLDATTRKNLFLNPMEIQALLTLERL